MCSPAKIEAATVNQLATAVGILIDKFTAGESLKRKNRDYENQETGLLKEFIEAIGQKKEKDKDG